MVGALQDISEQKVYEERLSQERNLLRTVIDNIPDYIFVKDNQKRLITANAANIKLLGGNTEEEIIGKTVYEFFPKELADLYDLDDQVVLTQKKAAIDKEEPILDENGSQRWLNTTKIPLSNSKGDCWNCWHIQRYH